MSDKDGKKEFMSKRYNIIRKRREIRKQLTMLENYLLDDIELGTLGDWDSSNEFDLDELADGLGVKKNKVYAMLKNLKFKDIIVREPTKYPGREVLGLNPSFFGQILTNHQNELEKRRHLKIVVDNSKNEVPNKDRLTPESGSPRYDGRSEQVPNRDLIHPQDPEIIDENFSSDSYRYNKKSSEGKERNAPLLKTGEKSHFEMQMEEHERLKKEQLPRGDQTYQKLQALWMSRGAG